MAFDQSRNTISVVNDYFSRTTRKPKLNQETLLQFAERTNDSSWAPVVRQTMQRRMSDGGMNIMENNKNSAFSEVYLDGKTKDLLSLKMYDQRAYDPTIASKNSTLYLNQRQSTIHAPTLIERLQDDTNEAKKNMHHSRSPRQFQGKDNRLLLSRVMSSLQTYSTDV